MFPCATGRRQGNDIAGVASSQNESVDIFFFSGDTQGKLAKS